MLLQLKDAAAIESANRAINELLNAHREWFLAQDGRAPLALDQAGAYIEETGCSLADYQQLYQRRRGALLKERRGLVADHPEAIATTVSLAVQQVEQNMGFAHGWNRKLE